MLPRGTLTEFEKIIPETQTPDNLRQTFELFARYDPGTGLSSILKSLDFSGVSRRQVYSAVLGRLPVKRSAFVMGTRYSAHKHFEAALSSDEFQTRVRELVAQAYPEKRRLIFIHVPKAAGTDMNHTLARTYPRMIDYIAKPAAVSKQQMYCDLRELVTKLARSDTISFTGHVHLKWYLSNGFVRPHDHVMAVVREPHKLVVSFANFILTRFIEYQHVKRRDTDEWYGFLDMQRLPDNPTQEYLVSLGRRILRCEKIVARNVICRYLGRSTADSALDNIVRVDAELTDVTRYSAWRKARFGIEFTQRHNKSRPILNEETLSVRDRDYIREITDEDQRLYEVLVNALENSSEMSIRGNMLADLSL